MSESGGGSKNECLKHEHTDQQRHLVHHRNITQTNTDEEKYTNCDHCSIGYICVKTAEI